MCNLSADLRRIFRSSPLCAMSMTASWDWTCPMEAICPMATRQTPRSGSACGKRQSKHEVPCLWVHMMALAAMCGNIFAFLSNNLRISMVSKYFESIPYRLNEETGLIDYDECEKFALRSAVKMRRIYHRATLGSIWGTVPVNCVTSCEPRLDCFPA